MLVKESISFERYKDPKTALGVGGEAIVRDAIDHIFREDDAIPYFHTIFGIDISPKSKTFTIQFYSDDFTDQKTGKLNKKNRAIELVKNAGIDEYFYEVDYSYKMRWWIVFKIKPEYQKFFKPIWIDGIDYRKSLKESVSFERYKDPKKALGLTTLDSIRQWMIDSGHNVHPTNPEKQELERYLAYAVNDNKTEYAQYLLHIGVDPNRAPLGIAVRDDNFEMVKMLLDAGANFEFSKDTNASKEMKDFLKNYKK